MIIWYRIVGVLFLAICLFVAGHQINEELRLLRYDARCQMHSGVGAVVITPLYEKKEE